MEGSGLEGTVMSSFAPVGSGRPGSPRRSCAVEGRAPGDVGVELGGGQGCRTLIQGSLAFR